MDSNGIVSYPIHSIANAFHWIGMHTITMDTYSFVSGGGVVVEGALTRQDPALPRVRGRQPSPMNGFATRRSQANDGEKSP